MRLTLEFLTYFLAFTGLALVAIYFFNGRKWKK